MGIAQATQKVTSSQEGTLLLYPVAKTTESNSNSCPSTNLAPWHVTSLTPGITCKHNKDAHPDEKASALHVPPRCRTPKTPRNPQESIGENGKAKKPQTLIFPCLILASAPTSRTGVFPATFLSSSGPILGLGIPCFLVLPNVVSAHSKRNLSTTLSGSHLRSAIDIPNVENPRISLGRTCTYMCGITKRQSETKASPTDRKP